MAVPVLKLNLALRGRPIREYTFVQETVSIGRDPQSDIFIDNLRRYIDGRPLGTVPTVAMPRAAKSSVSLATIAPITAMSAPGMRGANRAQPTISTRTVAEMPSVVRCVD